MRLCITHSRTHVRMDGFAIPPPQHQHTRPHARNLPYRQRYGAAIGSFLSLPSLRKRIGVLKQRAYISPCLFAWLDLRFVFPIWISPTTRRYAKGSSVFFFLPLPSSPFPLSSHPGSAYEVHHLHGSRVVSSRIYFVLLPSLLSVPHYIYIHPILQACPSLAASAREFITALPSAHQRRSIAICVRIALRRAVGPSELGRCPDGRCLHLRASAAAASPGPGKERQAETVYFLYVRPDKWSKTRNKEFDSGEKIPTIGSF